MFLLAFIDFFMSIMYLGLKDVNLNSIDDKFIKFLRIC